METARVFEFCRVVPGHPMYVVTESGKVGRIGKDTWLNPCVLKRGGYLAVSLWTGNRGKTRPVHQLVTEAFHGARPSRKHDAAHVDGDKWNNHHSNLRWSTRAENEADKVRHGKSNRGERNGHARLSDAQAREIRDRANRGENQGALAIEFGVTQSAISNIKRGVRRAY